MHSGPVQPLETSHKKFVHVQGWFVLENLKKATALIEVGGAIRVKSDEDCFSGRGE